MSIVFFNKEYLNVDISKYAKIIGINKEVLNNHNIEFCRVWNDCGLINCHTYPIEKDKTDIMKLVNEVYDIVKILKDNKIKINSKYTLGWQLESNILKSDNIDEINIYTLIAYLVLIYGKEESIFKISKIIEYLN